MYVSTIIVVYLVLKSNGIDLGSLLHQCISGVSDSSILILCKYYGDRFCLQCFDAVGWAAGRASGL